MIKISKKVEYALMAIKHLHDSSDDEQVTAKAIAEKYGSPFDTTSRMMQMMNTANILKSIQGTKGGYKLNINLKHISYFDLVEIVEGKELAQECSKLKCTIRNKCNISAPYNKLNAYIKNALKSITLDELLTETNSPINFIRSEINDKEQKQ